MADSPETTTEQAAEAAPRKKPGIMTLVKALAFISVIVLIELACASMFFPSEEETEQIAEKLAVAEAAQDPEQLEGTESEESTAAGTFAMRDMKEVPLGSYHVPTYNQKTGTSLNVDFELFGTVLADEESEFFHLYEANQVRIREQVLVTTSRALGKPLLHEAGFSEYSFVER